MYIYPVCFLKSTVRWDDEPSTLVQHLIWFLKDLPFNCVYVFAIWRYVCTSAGAPSWCGCWEQKSGPLRGQQMLLATGPALAPGPVSLWWPSPTTQRRVRHEANQLCVCWKDCFSPIQCPWRDLTVGNHEQMFPLGILAFYGRGGS